MDTLMILLRTLADHLLLAIAFFAIFTWGGWFFALALLIAYSVLVYHTEWVIDEDDFI